MIIILEIGGVSAVKIRMG